MNKLILILSFLFLFGSSVFAEVVYDRKAIPWDFKPGQKIIMKRDTNPNLVFKEWIGVKCLEGTQTGNECTFITPETPIEPGAVYLHKKKGNMTL